jgi:hypothetical protein
LASFTGVSVEIHSVQTISGNQPRMRRIIEEATQTFLNGTPVTLAAGDGGVQAWVQGATKIAGFVKEAGNNLAATGVIPTAAVNPATQPKFGSVPNEASAVNITRPFFLDGRIAVELANADTVFLGQTNDTVTQANVGVTYNLTKDTDNHWYVDLTNTTNLVATIVRLDPNDQLATHNRGVYFVITPAFWQIGG